MFMLKILFILFSSIIPLTLCSEKKSDDKYFKSTFLDKENSVRLSWKFDKETITFELKAKSKGWVGLGFSPTGAMTGSDIVVCWVDESGKGRISDRFGIKNGYPPVDKHQDYNLVKGKKFDDEMVFVFNRKINTCDKEDRQLMADATRLIYAFDDDVPRSDTVFDIHDFNHRGSKTVYLFDPPNVEHPLPKDVVTVEFLAKNVSVPDDFDTLYWCEVIEMPDLKVPHHLIRYEPVVQSGHEPFVHHIVLTVCGENMKKHVGKGGPCFDRTETNLSEVFKECSNNLIFVWAVGGEGYSFPDDVGVLMFGEQKSRYFMIEMHYDNSNYRKNIVDNSGMRLFLTPTLRKIPAGKAFVGAPVGPEYQIIPPGQEKFTTYAYCSAECTKNITKDGWTILTVMVHEHKAGVSGRLRHIRDGVMLEDIISDDHYDFKYQNTRIISNTVKIMPGDQLISECTYNTVERDDVTFGGYATRKEMCLFFIDLYPLNGIFSCLSAPMPSDTWQLFDANFSTDATLKTVDMIDGTNMTLGEFATTQIRFDSEYKIEKFQTAVRDSKHLNFCGMTDTKASSDIVVENLKKTSAVIQNFHISIQNGYPQFKSATRTKPTECVN